jgi:hypothetical protein
MLKVANTEARDATKDGTTPQRQFPRIWSTALKTQSKSYERNDQYAYRDISVNNPGGWTRYCLEITMGRFTTIFHGRRITSWEQVYLR